MISQVTGALLRALLMVVLVALPALLLPGLGAETTQVVAFMALFAGALTFVEYASTYPGLIEFRHAPPFNRLRFAGLAVTVGLLSLLCRDWAGPAAGRSAVTAAALALGGALDFPYSPVRLASLILPADAPAGQIALMRAAAGLSYTLSLVMLAVFVLVLRSSGWPGRNRGFNLWVNLPTFDPSAGGDIVARLERDAVFNLSLGFLLPFVIPAVIKAGAATLVTVTGQTPQTLVWVMTAWAFLPASLVMRGMAMNRIARLIREQRRSTLADRADTVPSG